MGASGGIMGLIGFMLVLAIRLRGVLPKQLMESMLEVIVIITLYGAFLWNIIDNAAHAGGLLGGILVGLIFIKRQDAEVPYKETKFVKVVGCLATLIVLCGLGKVFVVLF